ncbi:hypothetical protein BD410DRAFT_844692 [Rickenella mellea]|uniref:Uncharacterized protein n=1 Tax=Rickenella mellea TaxID=50990 RepID=A0A4Y7PM00_9AGAM|nr:hypothetical protein BD410DRAFT_844692 [Rickenella mellea]
MPSILEQRFWLVGQILGLILDVLVFGFTFAKTIRHAIEMRRVALGNGLGYFILRDGTMYFLAKLMFGVLGTILFFIPVPDQTANWFDVTPSIANSVALLLAIRLVLNLRQVSRNQEAGNLTLGGIETIRDPVFATNSFLGNIGAQLRVGPNEEEEIEEIPIDVEKCEVARGSEITDRGHLSSV